MSKRIWYWSIAPLLLSGSISVALANDAEAFAKAFAQGAEIKYAALDLDALSKQDEITDKIAGLPARFAVAHEVAGDTESLGA